MTSNFEAFCGGTFWNASLTWGDVTWPEFTHCFQHTVPVWVPCLFVWVTLPLNLHYMISHRGVPISLSNVNIAKMVMSTILVILTVTDIILASGSGYTYGGSVPDTLYVTPAIQAVTMILTIALFYMERRLGFITSGVQFFFWLFLLIFNIVPFYTRIFYTQDTDTEYDATLGPMIVFYLQFLFIFIQFVLQFKVEILPPTAYAPSLKRPCPEILASFFSRISFGWISSVVFLGYKKSLVESDLWDLNPRDKCSSTVPVFQKAWKEELEAAKKENEAQQEKYDIMRSQSSTKNIGEKTPLIPDMTYVGKAFTKSKPEKKVSIFSVMSVLYGPTLMKAVFFKLCYDILMFVNPQILSLLIEFTENKSIQEWKGYVYIVAMFASNLAQSVFFHQNYHTGITLGMRLKAVFIAAIYRKSLIMNSEARKTSTVGEIVNLMSVDAQRVQDVTGFLWMMFSCPFQIIVCMVFLYLTLGPSVFAGLAFMIILMPTNAIIAYYMRKLQVKQMQLKDERIKLLNEVLNGMKVIKLYAWEKLYEQKITKIRQQEVAVLRKLAYMSGFSTIMWTTAPYLVTFVTFITYIFTSESHRLDANKAFVAVSLFNILRYPINLLPMVISYIIQAQVSISRIGRFLTTGELAGDSVSYDTSAQNMLSIKNGVFSWEENDVPVLNNINIEVPQGKLVAVIGPVGVGKSSLLSAFLGEMEKITGHVNIKGSVAYVPQQAWIQHATLQNNILFGTSYDHDKYNTIIDSCALRPDLAILSDGDMTEIGEKGINLSGGQKQRVSLARAVYNDADIYLLDDPLSAVDSHVGKHLFDQIIGNKGLLKNKTRVLVTHGVHWLPLVDTVVVMDGGRVSEMGSYEDLMQHNGAFAKFIRTYLTIDKEISEEDEPDEIKDLKALMLERAESIVEDVGSAISSVVRMKSPIFAAEGDLERSLRKSITKSREHRKSDININEKRTLVQEERSETGQVSYHVYGVYSKAIGVIASITIVTTFVLYNISQALANVWLSQWTEDTLLKNLSITDTGLIADQNDYYIGIIGMFGLLQVSSMIIYACVFAVYSVRAAATLHRRMLINIFHNPMSFFDTTPIGRIMNRFSRDIETIDNNLPQITRQFFNTFFNVVITIIVISVTTPLFLTVIIPLVILYYIIQRFYIATSRQLKRIESTSRSPIFTHFTETIQGASSIRAYRVSEQFTQESDDRVDHNLIFFFSGIASNRWLGMRLEVISNLVIVAAALFAVLGRDTLSGGLVGLSVSYAMQVTGAMGWMVRMSSDLETNVVSVERVKEYSETPNEAAWDIDNTKPSPDWPETGRIEFMDYSTRYRPGLDLVLRRINCTLNAGEKVGVVGRTGAGKSSLTLALFRIIEAAGGGIVIDDRTVADMGLHDLRSRLTILPQDPVLFSGTLRMNLDPHEHYTDSMLWQVLDTANLKTFVWSLPERLNHECGEGGCNLSVGQRQLLCLARTLLKKTKILILDEATAAVDMETDDLIQQAIRSEFSECTVVTIAHRLNTIMDYDRVMVLDQGCIKEFDSPTNLLNDDTSLFYSMAKDAGLTH